MRRRVLAGRASVEPDEHLSTHPALRASAPDSADEAAPERVTGPLVGGDGALLLDAVRRHPCRAGTDGREMVPRLAQAASGSGRAEGRCGLPASVEPATVSRWLRGAGLRKRRLEGTDLAATLPV